MYMRPEVSVKTIAATYLLLYFMSLIRIYTVLSQLWIITIHCKFPPHIICHAIYIIESVDSINRDERGFPLTQYITNGGISRARNTITDFKHHHRVLRRISNRMSV